MKKLVSAALAAVTLFSSTVSFGAAADEDLYTPTLYMIANKYENVSILPSGKIFINKNDIESDTAAIGANVYIDDKSKKAGMVFVKWRSVYDGITLTNLINPLDIEGVDAYPYAEYEEKRQFGGSVNVKKGFHAVSYISMAQSPETGEMMPLTIKGSASDDYPLAGFEASVDMSIECGEYEIEFMNEGTNRCDILMRLEDGSSYEVFPMDRYARALKIAVADTALGDVDCSGKFEASDASAVLAAYTYLSSGKDSGLNASQEAAADVDGDGMITASDASWILAYYTYLAGNEMIDIVDFMNKQ